MLKLAAGVRGKYYPLRFFYGGYESSDKGCLIVDASLMRDGATGVFLIAECIMEFCTIIPDMNDIPVIVLPELTDR